MESWFLKLCESDPDSAILVEKAIDRLSEVGPALVAGCIRRALERGWNPGQQGSAFTLIATDDEPVVLLSEPPQYLIPFLWGMIPEGGGIGDLPRCTEIWGRDKHNTSQAPSDAPIGKGKRLINAFLP